MATSSSKLRAIPAKALGFFIVCMAIEWILLVAGVKPHEMLVGALSITAAAVFLYAAMHVGAQRILLRAGDLAQICRLPGMMLSDAWTVTVVLMKDLFGIERAGSFYRVSGFRTAKEDPLLVGRRVLATVYTTSTPNSIIIGIDPAQSRMLVHQLRRAPASKLERHLGSQS